MWDRQVELIQLRVIPAIEMMDLQILVAFAFGEPQNGSFQSYQLVALNPLDLPLGTEPLARLITTILSAQQNG